MNAKLIPCKAIADDMIDLIACEIFEKNYAPSLTIYANPYDPAGVKYVQNKVDAAARCGIKCTVCNTTTFIGVDSLTYCIRRDESDGIIVQLPLEDRFKDHENEIINSIPKTRDVDGLSLLGFNTFIPCTAYGVMRILDWVAKEKGINYMWPYTNTVIVGRSKLVGYPLAADLIRSSDMTVTVCNSKTKDLELYTRYADVVITACGVPGRITKDMLSPGATLIDVGINEVNGKLVGDATKDCDEVCGYIARIGKQGGPGKMTVASLMHNVLRSYKIRYDSKFLYEK